MAEKSSHASLTFTVFVDSAMAALQERRKRWTCPECGTVNRAWREMCFECDVAYTYSAAASLPATKRARHVDDNALVEFKDENSKVIAKMKALTAVALKSDLQYVVSRLATSNKEFSDNKHENLKKTCILQRQMRLGQQVVQDFQDPGALWGYARRKFSSRATIAFELFSSARDTLLESEDAETKKLATNVLESNPTVVSIGGGPGNDLFGYLLFQRHVVNAQKDQAVAETLSATKSGEPNQSSTPSLYVCDFAPGWSPIVARVGELSDRNIQFQTCNLNMPLQHQAQEEGDELAVNNALNKILEQSASRPVVLVFCYVLSEVMGPSGDPPPLLEDLFCFCGAHRQNVLLLFREPHTQALETLLDRHNEDWQEGRDYWHLSYGGLMIRASSCK